MLVVDLRKPSVPDAMESAPREKPAPSQVAVASPPAPPSRPLAVSEPIDLPIQTRSNLGVVALLLALVAAGAVAGTWALRAHRTPVVPVDPPVAPAALRASPPVDAPKTSQSGGAAAPLVVATSADPEPTKVDPPPATGWIKTTGTLPGRRIFVDGKTLGQTPHDVSVPCGTRSVKLGSAGHTQSIDVPCGGEITLGAR
jgi:hypothetical protein